VEDYSSNAKLEDIRVDKIKPNPDNPRLTFRQGELDELQESIRLYGVQVPIAVYRDGPNYVLIDGERRWRCASKLNQKTIPALVQEKPSPLQNLLLMFNIHSLREEWDLLTIALKLPQVIKLLQQEKDRQPTEAEISNATGLTRSIIRRSKLLMDLPSYYKDKLLDELKRPKAKQQLSEDFFIEMEKALKTVKRAMPGIVEDVNGTRDILLEKYESGVIKSIIDFRKVAKIARAGNVGADTKKAETALRKLFTLKSYSIDRAFEETVSGAYAERDIVSRIEALLARLEEAPDDAIDDDVREKLGELVERAQALLEATE
jgi:ParB family transcriptional regulator, chromosome partitioning protein